MNRISIVNILSSPTFINNIKFNKPNLFISKKSKQIGKRFYSSSTNNTINTTNLNHNINLSTKKTQIDFEHLNNLEFKPQLATNTPTLQYDGIEFPIYPNFSLNGENVSRVAFTTEIAREYMGKITLPFFVSEVCFAEGYALNNIKDILSLGSVNTVYLCKNNTSNVNTIPDKIFRQIFLSGWDHGIMDGMIGKYVDCVEFYDISAFYDDNNFSDPLPSSIRLIGFKGGFKQKLQPGVIGSSVKYLIYGSLGSYLDYNSFPSSVNSITIFGGNQYSFGSIPPNLKSLDLNNITENMSIKNLNGTSINFNTPANALKLIDCVNVSINVQTN